MDDDTVLEFIIADEQMRKQEVEDSANREDEKEEQGRKQETVVVEMRDIHRSTTFSPEQLEKTSVGDKRVSLPIKDKGLIDSSVIIADSSDYSIQLIIDQTIVHDTSFTQLESISGELARTSAYERSGEYVTAFSGYEFEEYMNIEIVPKNEMTFKIVRVEAVLGENLNFL